MKCMMVSRIDDKKALLYTRALGDTLEKSGYEVLFEPKTAHALGQPPPAFSRARPDLAIIIGGDGTILRTVQDMELQVPIIGINWGEVGFLTDLEPEEAEDVLTTISDGFLVE